MLCKWLCLCVCILPLSLCYSPDRIFYQFNHRNAYSHEQLWIRQIEEDDLRANPWQRPIRQTQICEGPGRQRGRCVRMEDCVLQDLHRDYVKNRDYFCIMRNSGSIGVCCPDTVVAPVTYREGIFTPTTVRPVTSPPRPDQPIFQQQQSAPMEPVNGDVFPVGDFRVCGLNGKKISRITEAAPTTVRDWPWMAAIVYRRTLKQYCGGTLISRRHVLTAAHCFPREDPDEMYVVLGDYDLKRNDDSKSRVFSVIQMFKHEDFDVTTFENDITILVLNGTTVYNSFIQPCCLPPPGPRFANLTTVVTGWGKTEFGGPSSSLLMEVPVPIWAQERCTPNFAQTIFDTALCAGAFDGGKDACQGDSGGPLVMQRRDERWAIVGIVSWGIRCGEKNKPGVYTRVNDYLDWIVQAIL